MRTLQVINVQWYNATAWYAVHLAHALTQAGHPSSIVGIKDSLPILEAKKLGLNVYELPLNSMLPKDIWKCTVGIDAICRAFKPDIVNCHRGESFFLWALKKHKFNYKLIRTRGDQRLPLKNIINKVLHHNFSDAIISTNSKMTNYFASQLHIPRTKLHTVLGGVSTQHFYPSKTDRDYMRMKYNFTDTDVVIGVIGRLDPVKGHKEVLQVFANIYKKEPNSSQRTDKSIDLKTHQSVDNVISQGVNPDADNVAYKGVNPEIYQNLNSNFGLNAKLHLVIVGGDCDYTIESLSTLGKKLDIPQENLHCIGYVENMQKIMCMLDMGLIASLSSETVARVAFEMIACHVPIIGSNVGVMPDILDKKYLYDPYDFDRMSDLLLMSKNPSFRNELLDLCVERFEATESTREDAQKYMREETHGKAQEKSANGEKNSERTRLNHSIYGWSVDAFVKKTLTIYKDCLK